MTREKSLRRLVGFWPSLLATPIGQLLIPEGLFALALGGFGGMALLNIMSIGDRIGLVGDFLVILGPLLGIVFAALALVASLMSDRYLAWLRSAADDTSQNVLSFFTPFMVSLGIQVGALLSALFYRATAENVSSAWESAAFVAVMILGVLSLLEVLALGRSVLMHTYVRASEAEISVLESKVQDLHRKAD